MLTLQPCKNEQCMRKITCIFALDCQQIYTAMVIWQLVTRGKGRNQHRQMSESIVPSILALCLSSFQVHKFLLHLKESESVKILFFSFLYCLGCSKQRKDGSNSNWQLQANLVVKIGTKSLELFHKIISPAVRFLFRQRKLELLIL